EQVRTRRMLFVKEVNPHRSIKDQRLFHILRSCSKSPSQVPFPRKDNNSLRFSVATYCFNASCTTFLFVLSLLICNACLTNWSSNSIFVRMAYFYMCKDS